MARVLLNVPKSVARGVPFEVRILISHPMESGQRRDDVGQAVPRQIIHSFACTLNGQEVIRLTLHPAIAANPFLAFSAVAQSSGTLSLTWTDDAGVSQTETAAIAVA